jgi:hypothetical protein
MFYILQVMECNAQATYDHESYAERNSEVHGVEIPSHIEIGPKPEGFIYQHKYKEKDRTNSHVKNGSPPFEVIPR